MDTLDYVLSKLDKVTGHGAYWMARCPAHDDRSPSLMISEGDTPGLVLLHCFAGCSFQDIASALEMTPAELCGRRADATADELWRMKIEARVRRLEREQHAQKQRRSALERMARCKDHLIYNHNLNEQHREWWWGQGIYDEAIDHFTLGFCSHCPSDWTKDGDTWKLRGRPSYTIPIIEGGVPHNIRHRLERAPNGDKYRPHMAGLGASLFNVDDLRNFTRVILWEGEKKAAVMWQHLSDRAHVGAMGKLGFDDAWFPLFDRHEVIIALDPDAEREAYRLARRFKRAGRVRSIRVAAFPVKPDDMINLHNATLLDVDSVLHQARPV